MVPIETAVVEDHQTPTTPQPQSASAPNVTVECSAKKRKASPFVAADPSSSSATNDLELQQAAAQAAAENSLSFVPSKLARVAVPAAAANTLPNTSLQHLVSTRVAPSLGNAAAPGAATANHVANINNAILAQLQAQSALGRQPQQASVQLGTPTLAAANQQPQQLTVQGSFAIAQPTQSQQISLIAAAGQQQAALQAAQNRQAVLLAGKQEESAAAQVLKLPDVAAGQQGAVVASAGGHQIINSAGKPTAMSIQQKDTTYTKIFVGGLPYHTTDSSLRDYFAVFGEIDEAVVITDRQTGKSRGYGFVSIFQFFLHLIVFF